MKSSVVTIIGGAVVILGCGALAFAGLLAWLAWGGSPGGWSLTAPEFANELKFDMVISAVIGLVGIALGWRMRYMKSGSNGKLLQKTR